MNDTARTHKLLPPMLEEVLPGESGSTDSLGEKEGGRKGEREREDT